MQYLRWSGTGLLALSLLFFILTVPSSAQTQFQTRGRQALTFDQLDSASYWFNQLHQYPHPDSQLVRLTGLLEIAIRQTQLERGDSIRTLADDVIRRYPIHSIVRFRYLSTRAQFYNNNSNPQRGLAEHLSLRSMLQKEPAPPVELVANNLLNIGMTYELMSQYDSALHYVQLAYPLFQSVYDTTEAVFSNIYNSLAVCYFRNNQLDKAERFYKKSIAIARNKIGPFAVDLANSLNNLSGVYRRLEAYDLAIQASEEALNIFQVLQDDGGVSRAFYALGVFHYFKGDYGRSRDYLEACLDIRKRLYAPDHYRLIDPLNVLAIALEEAGDYPATLNYLRQGRMVIQKNFGRKNISMGYNLDNTALAFVAMENYDSAWHYIQQSNAILPQLLPPNDYALWVHYLSLARIHYFRGRYPDALRSLNKSDNVARLLGLDVGIDFAENKVVRAEILSAMGRYQEAESFFLEAMQPLISEPTEPLRALSFHLAPRTLDVLHAVTNFHFQKWSKTGNIEELVAFRSFSNLLQEVSNAMRRQFDDPYTKRILSKDHALNSKRLMGQWVQIYRLTGDEQYLQDIYELSEYSRATLLRDLQNQQVTAYAGLPDSVFQEEVGLRQKVTELETRYLNNLANDEARIALFQARESLNQFIEKIRARYPRYYQLVFADQVRPLPTIQEQLDPKTGIISLIQDDSSYHALVISQNLIRLHTLGAKANIDKMVQEWRACIQSRCPQWKNISYGLFQTVWQPLIPDLPPPGSILTIVPTGVFNYLNLEGLVTDPVGSDFLLESYPMHWALSLSTQWTKGRKIKPGKVLAIAPGFEPQLKEQYLSLLAQPETRDLQYLQTIRQPWSVQLAHHLGRRTGYQALTGQEARESLVKEQLPQGGILYFGTHAQANASDPMRSRLILSKETDADATEDGYLHAYELYGIPLSAELAILNACESGLGAIQEGEGMISLAYSMQYAGCPSTIMSLWKIDERTSTQLIQNTLYSLEHGQSRLEALRKAKIDFLAKARGEEIHPYYWSGLILLGQEGTIPLPKRAPPAWWLVLAAIAAIFGFLAIRK